LLLPVLLALIILLLAVEAVVVDKRVVVVGLEVLEQAPLYLLLPELLTPLQLVAAALGLMLGTSMGYRVLVLHSAQ
jgi:hypothetical protein